MVEFTNKKLRAVISKEIEDLKQKRRDGSINPIESDYLKDLEVKGDYTDKFDQGLTLGGSDEIKAGIQSILPNSKRKALIETLRNKTGENISSYDFELAQQRGALENFVGYDASAVEAAGSVAPYLLGGRAKIMQKVMNPKSYKGAAGATAADSGVYGFLTGEGFQDRMTRAGIYGTGGLFLGPAVRAVGNVGKSLYNKVTPPGKEQAIALARKNIADTLAIEGMTVKDAIAKLIGGKDSKLVLADLGTTGSFTNYLQAIKELDEPSYQKAVKWLADRKEGKPKRLYHLFSGGSTEGNLIDGLLALKKARKTDANKHYNAAFYNINNKTGQQGSLKFMPIGEELNSLFQTPNFKSAFESAKNLALEKNKRFPYKLVDGAILDINSGKKITKIPTLYLHYLKKGYDDYLSALYKNPEVGTLQTGAIQENKNKLVNFILKDKNYKKGRDIYSGSYDLAKAMELGDSVTKNNITYQDIIRELQTYTTSQKEAFRIRAVDALVAKMEKDGVDVATRRFMKSDNNKKLLKLSFTGNADLSKPDKAFDKFYANLTNELETKMTENAVMSGSKTAKILQTGDSLIEKNIDFNINPSTLLKSIIGEGLIGKNNEFKRAFSEEMTSLLTSLDPSNLNRLMDLKKQGKSWKDIIKQYPVFFKPILKAPFSPQALGFTIQEAAAMGYGGMVEGEISGRLNEYGIFN